MSVLTDEGGPDRPHPESAKSRFYTLRYEQGTNVTVVSSDVVVNTSWTTAGSPYVITNDIRIRDGATLTIGSGVRVLFGSTGRLTVEGSLRTSGQPAQSVVFTSNRSYAFPGDWLGIRFLASSSGAASVLSNAIIEYAVTGISCSDASPNLTHCTIRRCSQNGVVLERSSSVVENCVIERNAQDGIYATGRSTPQVLGNTLRGNGRDGILLTCSTSSDQNCRASIRGNQFYDNVRNALTAQSFYQASAVVLDARGNWWGTGVATEIAARVYDIFDSGNSPWVDYGSWLQAENAVAAPGSLTFGTVSADTAWRASDSPVWVLGSLTIASNVTLQVDPGVTVNVLGNGRVDVLGTLAVGGATNAPVVFTSAQPVPKRGDWVGIRFNKSNPDVACVLSNVVVAYAQTGIVCSDASPMLVGCAVIESSQNGVYLERSSPLIQGGRFENNTQDGIYCTWLSSPQITGNRIRLNGSDGIELAGYASSNRNCLPLIQGNVIEGNAGFALRTGSYFQPASTVIDARGNWWGTAVAQSIGAMIYDYQDATSAPWVDFGGWQGAASGGPVLGASAVGPITQDTVWRLDNSPVTVIGPVTIATNTSVRIEAGVEVLFMGKYRLDVAGALEATGTPAKPVVFTSGDAFGLPGDWQGIRFLESSMDSACVLSNVVVEFAEYGVQAYDASPTLVGCWIQDCSQHGVYLNRSSPLIKDSTVCYNLADGIHCTNRSAPVVVGNRVQGNGADGIKLSGLGMADQNSLPVIVGNDLDGNAQYGLRALTYYRPTEILINARSNWWGTAVPAAVPGRIYDALDASTSPWVDWGNWLTSEGGTATAGRAVLGTVTNSTVWQTADSPVWMLGPLTVASNVTVTVDPGVTVRVPGNWRLDVDGALSVAGTTDAPVLFTSGQKVPRRGDWQGIRFRDSSMDAGCVWSNVIVEFAQNGIQCVEASPVLHQCWVRECSLCGLYLEHASPVVRDGTVENNTLDGIYCTNRASPQVVGNWIRGNGSDGIELAGTAATNWNCLPTIHGNAIVGNTNYAVNTHNYYQPATVAVDARNNWWGTEIGEKIPAYLFDALDAATSPWMDWGNWRTAADGPAVPGRFVFGTIATDTVWHSNDGFIGVLGPVTVASNAVLTIEAGLPIHLYGKHRIEVAGGLRGFGEQMAPILFTSGRLAPTNGDWEGIRFLASTTNQSCLLSNVVVEFASTGVSCTQTSPTLFGCQIRRNGTGVSLNTSAALLRSNLIELNFTGIACTDLAAPLIQGNSIVYNATNGIDIRLSSISQDRNARPVLEGNSFIYNSTAGPAGFNIYAGAFYQPASVTLMARPNWWSGALDTNLIESSIYHRRDSSSSPTVDFSQPLEANPNFAVLGQTASIFRFSPNHDGVDDTVAIRGRLSHDAVWKIAILDADHCAVAAFAGSGTDLACVWDGNTSDGTPAPEGWYRAVAFATNTVSSAVAFSHGDYVRLDRIQPRSLATIPGEFGRRVASTSSIKSGAGDPESSR